MKLEPYSYYFFLTICAYEYFIFTRTFLPVPAPLGSIPELPARSCQEITASEGKDTPTKNYWLDPSGTGKAVLVYCDMDLEG